MTPITQRLAIQDIIEETEDSKTFVLASVDGQPLEYQAGQFLTF
ncbi:MAG TPA: ferredoxin, partial [Runella sp.]|nr:ferredoxin [Runella sp.]